MDLLMPMYCGMFNVQSFAAKELTAFVLETMTEPGYDPGWRNPLRISKAMYDRIKAFIPKYRTFTSLYARVYDTDGRGQRVDHKA